MDFFDILLAKKLEDDRDPKVEGLSVTANGTYSEDGVVYKPVVVNVPETPLSSLSVTANGTYTAPTGTGYNEVSVNVPAPANALVIKDYESVPTSIASFNDGTANPLKSLTASIVPVQAGSGDPSPTNVRPISGWTEEVIRVNKKNFWELNLNDIKSANTSGTWVDDTYTYRGVSFEVDVVNGTVTVSGTPTNDVALSVPTPNIPNSDYIASGSVSGSSSTWFLNIRKNINGITTWGRDYKSGVSVSSGYFDRCQIYVVNGATISTPLEFKLMIEEGSTATTYEPYAGTTYTIQFKDGDNPLIVYGGTLDVTSGVLTVDKKSIDVSSAASGIGYNSGVGAGMLANTNLKPNITAETISEYASNCLKVHVNSNVSSMNYEFTVDANSGILFKVPNCSSASDYQTWVTNNNLQIVGKLATPKTYQLTPTSIKSLDGDNNVFASTGDVEELKYFTRATS